MSDVDLLEAVSVLRDEVLDTVEHGDRDPPGTEVFDALIRALTIGGESVPGLDLTLHDSVSRRLAWCDSEEAVLADAEMVFDRLMVAVERALRDPADRMVVIEAATQVAVTVARVVSLAARLLQGHEAVAGEGLRQMLVLVHVRPEDEPVIRALRLRRPLGLRTRADGRRRGTMDALLLCFVASAPGRREALPVALDDPKLDASVLGQGRSRGGGVDGAV